METTRVDLDPQLVSCDCAAIQDRLQIRTMPAEAFVEKHGTGTLRKNKRLGMAWNSQYLTERVRYEFGWEFEILPRSCLTFSDAITESDSKLITEAGWHAERYINMSIFPEDYFEVKYLTASYPDGKTKEGIGIAVRQTSAPWIPKGHLVFVIVAEYSTTINKYTIVRNPFQLQT